MNFYVTVLVICLVKLCFSIKSEELSVQVKEEPAPGGIWKTKVQWKAHWVKHWETRRIWIPVWRTVWGPVEVKEWIPFPKPPPTWEPPRH